MSATRTPSLLQILEVPDVLRGRPSTAEPFLELVVGQSTTRPFAFDLSQVTFVCPYGSMLLFEACQHLAALSGTAVSVYGMREAVHAYLERLDFFQVSPDLIYTPESLALGARLSRNALSTTVMPLMIVDEGKILCVFRRRRTPVSAEAEH